MISPGVPVNLHQRFLRCLHTETLRLRSARYRNKYDVLARHKFKGSGKGVWMIRDRHRKSNIPGANSRICEYTSATSLRLESIPISYQDSFHI